MIQRARMTWAIRILDSFSSSSSSVVGTSVEIYFSLEKSSPPPKGIFSCVSAKKRGKFNLSEWGGDFLHFGSDQGWGEVHLPFHVGELFRHFSVPDA